MKRIALTIFLCTVAAIGSGCDSSTDADHRQESHDEHSGQDEHGSENHADDEHSGTSDEADGHGAESDHDDHGDNKNVIELDPKAVERSGIRIAKAEGNGVALAVEVPAEVQFNPDRIAHVTPLVPGQLVEVFVDLGDSVKPGDRLAKFRSVEFGRARSKLERAKSMVDVATAAFDRQKKLRELRISSEQSFLEAQQALTEARAELNAARSELSVMGAKRGAGADDIIRAPISGTVVERHATRGEYVRPEDKLFVIGDLSEVWVMGRVPERDVGSLSVGDPTRINLAADSSRTWEGTIDYIASRLDEDTRTLQVRTELKNDDRALRPGLFGTMQLRKGVVPGASKDNQRVVALPEDAVQELGGAKVVFVPMPDDGEDSHGSGVKFEVVEVVTGVRADGMVEILEGVEFGQSVVVDGAFVLKSQKMRSELGHGHAH